LALNGLPRLRHPVFDTPDFDLASRNRFFLCIRSDDAQFDLEGTGAWLRGLEPLRVVLTPAEAGR
jgi:ActD protein